MLSHKTASWATEKKAIKEFPSVTNSDSKWKTNSETPRGAERRSERLSLVFSMMPPLGPDPTQHTIEFTFLPPFFSRCQTLLSRHKCLLKMTNEKETRDVCGSWQIASPKTRQREKKKMMTLKNSEHTSSMRAFFSVKNEAESEMA